jgi:hypothetical protein
MCRIFHEITKGRNPGSNGKVWHPVSYALASATLAAWFKGKVSTKPFYYPVETRFPPASCTQSREYCAPRLKFRRSLEVCLGGVHVSSDLNGSRFAAGDTVSQVIGARETRIDQVVDTSDFLSSLGTPESQARFVVVDSDTALTTIMNAPLAQWRVFLHPTQRKLAAGDRSGPVRILGRDCFSFSG